MYRVLRNLKVGIEANENVGEVGFVANWRAVNETLHRPAMIFGTSSDRIGTPDGQSYFVTLSKSLHHNIGIPVAPYVGISYSGYAREVIYPFGVNVGLPKGWSAMLMNDGVHTHVSASRGWRNFSFTVLAVERRSIGVTIGATF